MSLLRFELCAQRVLENTKYLVLIGGELLVLREGSYFVADNLGCGLSLRKQLPPVVMLLKADND